MVDYPHASAACLCYLGKREERRWMFQVFSLRLSTVLCQPYNTGKRAKSAKERPTSWTLQSAVGTKLLWTTLFRAGGLSRPG